ncbi:hypothetical protein ABZ721_37630 [Streptomyces sp. NPDC006733]|uniref:hypothetical protein n=1 Tax=Streptomyces sp. NPDC006733 TaxID=3155460 RepID=UPI0033FFAE46
MLLGGAGLTLITIAALRSGPSHGSGSGDGGTHTGPTGPTRSQQAYAVARQEFGLLAGGDWVHAWNLWTVSAQRTVPQDEFVHVNTACRPAVGIPYTIDGLTVTDPTRIRIDWHRDDVSGHDTLFYQSGQWRIYPDARTLAEYRPGSHQVIQQRRVAGSCH